MRLSDYISRPSRALASRPTSSSCTLVFSDLTRIIVTAPLLSPMKILPSVLHATKRPTGGSACIVRQLFVRSFMNEPIEEETLPNYRRESFYPIRLGDEINNRYRIVTKLGFGTSSTVWLARDKQKWAAAVLSMVAFALTLT